RNGCASHAARGDRSRCARRAVLRARRIRRAARLPEGRRIQRGLPRHRRAAPAVGGVGGAHFGGVCRQLNVAGFQAISLIVPPYPPPRYTKDEPEVSAWLRPGTDPPDYDSFGSVKYHYLANQQATDGDYGLYRVDIAPKA